MSNHEDHTQKDAFWDLEALLPPQKKKAAATPTPRDTEAVELRVPTVSTSTSPFADSLFVEHAVSLHQERRTQVQQPLFTYTPADSLLHEVRVYPWRTEYDYYEAFCKHARAFFNREGGECPQVEFFSYVPQYNQMNTAQMDFYLWWRSNFRRGVCLPVLHVSYLQLFLYELINVGDLLSPEEGQAQMLRLWLAYRKAHPRLDPLIREWLCDYSLLHRLSPPVLPLNLYSELLSGGKLKEFYVPLDGQGDVMTNAVLAFCNNYDYTKSKFYTEETAADFHRVLRGAVGEALSFLRESGEQGAMGQRGTSTVSRDAFSGAICSYRLKRRIEVEYTSFSHTHELRFIMTDVLKYAENALRAARGIRSRLSIYAVDAALRERLDGFFAKALPPRSTRVSVKPEEMPSYEKRYELPVVAPSPKRAAQIEADSWEMTRRLVEAFESGEAEEKTPAPVPPSTPPLEEKAPTRAEENAGSPLAAALGELVEFLVLADRRDREGQHAFARKIGMMPDAIVDKINTVSGDILGDILLEENGDGAFAVIEDYRELLTEQGVL